MEILIPLLIVAIIIGALLGGKSFGDTVGKGCGCITWTAIILLAIGAIFYLFILPEETSNSPEAELSNTESVHFISKKECHTYSKPDIESNISGHLEIGKELVVKDINQFNYFYEISDENGKSSYVRKECLEKK